MSVSLRLGDCLEIMRGMEAGSVDAVVTDPPYLLNFMGKEFDSQHRRTEEDGSEGHRMQRWHGRWAEAALRVLKPGGYMLAFGGTRTYHRLTCAVEDAGFEIRDSLMWIFASGFPKGKGCLKPAYEPIVLCRKPGPKVLPLGIDACRVEGGWTTWRRADGTINPGLGSSSPAPMDRINGTGRKSAAQEHPAGRWPANILFTHHPDCEPCGTRRVKGADWTDADTMRPNGNHHTYNGPINSGTPKRPVGAHYTDPDGMETVVAWNCHEACPVRRLDEQAGERKSGKAGPNGHIRNGGLSKGVYGDGKGLWSEAGSAGHLYGDTGNASRFFPCFAWEAEDFVPYKYVPKASRAERGEGNTHPCVKPISLCRWLVKLACPPGGMILDPFAGSGTTLLAALAEGFDAIGIEQDAEYHAIAEARIAAAQAERPLLAVMEP